MVCLGFEPRAARWKAKTNPLSYGAIPFLLLLFEIYICETSELKFVNISSS